MSALASRPITQTHAGRMARQRAWVLDSRVRLLNSRVRLLDIATLVGLYVLGLATRLLAVAAVREPLTEGSTYYVAVAQNLVTGRGLVIDSIWSYATPPLTLPRPAFELWQPMASFIAALPMAVLGPSYGAAQIGFALLGAALAPLAWLLARDTVRRLGISGATATAITVGAGVLAAISGPLLLSAAAPDSTLPFTVLALVACLLMPRAAAGQRRQIVALGVCLGLAYLTRMEAVWLGIGFVVVCAAAGNSLRRSAALCAACATAAALVALPWWLRNLAVFGTPFPGQLADNAFLTRNEQIFAYVDRPTLAGFLDQGLPTLLGNIGSALWHDLVDVLVVPAAPVALAALATLVVLLGRRRLPADSALGAVLISGAITFAATSVLFPVATLWGTFEHAAGALEVALVVLALVGAGEAVARIREWRAWPRSNAWLAPAALAALTLPLAALQVGGAATNAADDHARTVQLASAVTAMQGVVDDSVLISDRPIWLSQALGRPVIALPDEPTASVARLAADFGATMVILSAPRGSYPDALRAPAVRDCFVEQSLPGLLALPSSVFAISEACR